MESTVPLLDGHLCSRRRIAIHVIDVTAKCGISIVDHCMAQFASWPFDLDRGVGAIIFETACTAPNQAKLWVRVEAAVFYPSTQEKILARDPETDQLRGQVLVNLKR